MGNPMKKESANIEQNLRISAIGGITYSSISDDKQFCIIEQHNLTPR